MSNKRTPDWIRLLNAMGAATEISRETNRTVYGVNGDDALDDAGTAAAGTAG